MASSTAPTSMPAMDEFVKPADLFKMRRVSKNNKLTPQTTALQPSPMKCLNNFADPSPTKNLPTLLKNPFKNQPVKRRLNLGRSPSNSPIKRNAGGTNSNSNHSSPRKSPTKRSRMLEMDEDANMEAPRFRSASGGILTPRKRNQRGPCFSNDWTLRTKVKFNFASTCKNWTRDKATTHKRHSGSGFDEDTPSKVNDKTISLEAVRNAATVYQHPYFSWQSLFPRLGRKTSGPSALASLVPLARHSEAIKMMHSDWCESLDDLVNLLIDGKCPFFYLCSDTYNILFRHNGYQDTCAYISPMHFNFSSELKKIGIQVSCDDDNDVENSQSGFDELVLGRSSEGNQDDNNLGDDDDKDEDASQFLESLGVTVSQQDFPSIQSAYSKKPINGTTDSNSQSIRSVGQRPLATIAGVGDIRKLVKFLQTNQMYTFSKVGEFAFIPPTLLSPCEFRLSTPRYPEVLISQHVSGTPPTPPRESKRMRLEDANTSSQNKIDQTSSSSSLVTSTTNSLGPKFVEISGAILPNFYKRLHKLLTVSDNMDHTCSSAPLESSTPFKKIPFTNI